MDKITKREAMSTLLKAMAELAADVAGALSDADGRPLTDGVHVDCNQIAGTVLGVEADLTTLAQLSGSILALNRAGAE